MQALRLGILVDSPLKQQCLAAVVRDAGHQLVYTEQVKQGGFRVASRPPVDAWIVDLVDERESVENISAEQWLPVIDEFNAPVIVSHCLEATLGTVEYLDWQRRMLVRLKGLAGEINLQQAEPAPFVWVLAASTGGLAAVKTFLQALPANLNTAFVYVQHIDPSQVEVLQSMMARAGQYPCYLVQHGDVIRNQTIALVSANSCFDLLENGTFFDRCQPWPGVYSPSIDHVVANIARFYKTRCGVIIFTGMGDDGAKSSRLVRQRGGQVWVQSLASCASTSMPESAMAVECVDVIGDPTELAEQLTQFMNQPMFTRNRLP